MDRALSRASSCCCWECFRQWLWCWQSSASTAYWRIPSRNAARKAFKQAEVNAAYRDAGIVVNTDGVVPIDESKDVYKSSHEVVEAVTRAGLATIEHELVPLASIESTV